MLRSRFVSLCAIATVLFASTLLKAQQSAVSPRIVAPIDESKLIALPGGVPLLARSEFDLGRAPASTQMTFVRLVLSRSSRQEAALEKFMAEQLDPSSPNYHKWLTPQQFGSLYGPADSDVETLVSWLESHGFTVQPVAPGRTSIAFSGYVSQIEAAFHTDIHSFNANGVRFLSNVSSPSIPTALAPVVSGIGQLNTIRPSPHHVAGNMGKYDPELKRLVRAVTSSGPTPFLTGGSGTPSNPFDLFVVPGDAATIYNSPNSFNAGFSSGTSYTGTGVTIGIGGDATIQGSTVADYRTIFVGDSKQPTITNVSSDPATCTDANDPNGCDQDEAYLDNEIAGGLAPGATIHFYTSANLSLAIEQAISDNTVDIFSLSFGNCEANLTTADNALINGWWQQAASQGIAVTVSSGDNGSAGCDNDNVEQAATFGLQVSGFASTPYNIAVGGTDYIGLVNSFTTYVSTNSPSSTSGPNTASTLFRSALSYIPEATWNDSTTTDTSISANVSVINAMTGETNIVGGSGGASSCSTNKNNATSTTIATCTSGYAKPSWQRGAGVPSDGVRDLPDISLLAGNGFDDASWLVCTDDTGTVGTATVTANCTTQSTGSFYFYGFGGTSTSAPAFAGMLALVQQKTGSRLGQAAKNLYDLYTGSHGSTIFHDITTGNISVPCTSGTLNCSKNTAGYYFLTGYNTTAGYDLATGLGSVNITNLITYWGSTTGTSHATVSVTPSSSSITTNQSLTVTGTVTGAANTPTGTVTLTSGTYTSSAATLNGSGNYSISVPTASLTAGTDTLTVSYSGDSNYATGTGTATVTVTALTPTVSVTPTPTSGPVTDIISVNVKVSGSGPIPTGTATITYGGYTPPPVTLDATGTASFSNSIAGGSLGVGTSPVISAYSGDDVYSSASGSASIMLTKVTPTMTFLASDQTNIGAPQESGTNDDLAFRLDVGNSNAGAWPTGAVTYSINGGTPLAGTTLTTGNQGMGYAYVPWTSLPNGNDTITLNYAGDSNFSAASGSFAVIVHVYTPTIAVTPASSNITTLQSLSVPVTIRGTSGTPTGIVILSSGSYSSGSQTLSNGAYTFTIPSGALAAGSDTLTVSYGGDNNYLTKTGSAGITVSKVAPTLTVTPASSSIVSRQSLSITVKVAGTGATPTGTVTLTSGSYASSATTLSGGSATITIPANTFVSAGSKTLSVNYSGDSIYSTGSGSASITVTLPLVPTLTVTPASSTVDSGQSLAVAIDVAGVSGSSTPTGTITLTSGSYTSSATALTSGSASITIPANSLAAGTDTLTVSYSGDSIYTTGSGSASVTVTASAFALSGITPTAVSPGSSSSSTITVNSTTNYSGSVSLACALTTSPTGAVNSPSCSVTGSPITLSSSTTSGTATVNFSTTAASAVPGHIASSRSGKSDWTKAGAATLLAFFVFLGIPARRRAWRAIVGVLVLIAAFGTLSACGGGSSSGGGGGSTGTTAGTYTFTVTATGTPAVSPAPTATITLTVN